MAQKAFRCLPSNKRYLNRAGKFLFFAVVLLLTVFSTAVTTAPKGGELKVSAVKGKVVIKTGNGFERAAYKGLSVYERDMVKTYKGAAVEIAAPSGDVISILEMTALTIDTSSFSSQKNKTTLNIDLGKAYFRVNKLQKGSTFEVQTPFATAGVRGTMFSVESTGEKSRYRCYSGSLNVVKDGRTYVVNEGEELEEDINGVVGPRPISNEALNEFQKDIESIMRSTGNQGYLKQAVESVQKMAASRPGVKLGRPFQEQPVEEKITPSDKPATGGTVKAKPMPLKTESAFSESAGEMDIYVRAQVSVKFEAAAEKTEEEKDKDKEKDLAEELAGEKDKTEQKTPEQIREDEIKEQIKEVTQQEESKTAEEEETSEEEITVGTTPTPAGTTPTTPAGTTQPVGTTQAGTTPVGTTQAGTTPVGTTQTGTTPAGTTPAGTTTTGTTPSSTTPSGTTPTGTPQTTQDLATGLATGLPVSGIVNPVTIAVVQSIPTETSEAGNPGN